MRILILSDSHGRCDRMEKAFRDHPCEAAVFLGDGLSDFLEVAARYPSLSYYSVAGNCDSFSREKEVKIIEIEQKRIFLTHGHLHGVKWGLDRFISSACQSGACAALFGHTHRAYYEYRSGLLLMNPGSLGDPRKGSFGILEITPEKMVPQLVRL